MRSALTNFAVGLLFIIAFCLAVFGIRWQYFLQKPMNLPPEGMIYELKTGTSMKGLTQDLKARGIISKPQYLVYLAKLTGKATSLQAGEYNLIPPMTPSELLTLFTNGDVIQHPIRIGEGWTFKALRKRLAAQKSLVHLTSDMSDLEIMEEIGLAGNHPEGYFFPDTYYFQTGASDLDVLKRAHRKMLHVLYDEWAKREFGLPLERPYDALILASIIEKETGHDPERKEVSGVLIRRLEKGMRLQTDPTVIYGLGDAFDGNIRRQDLRSDTPYNTYVHKGLPITPIALPSLSSIVAALNPAPGNALYFVAKGDGTHTFSASLEEHNKAVREYLNLTRDDRS